MRGNAPANEKLTLLQSLFTYHAKTGCSLTKLTHWNRLKRDQNSEKSGEKERESSGGTENNSDGFPENL